MDKSDFDMLGESTHKLKKKQFEAGRILNDLMRKVQFTTDHEIVHLIYVQKFDRIVCILKKGYVSFIIQQYSMHEKARLNQFVINGEYLKGSHIEQNKDGTLFALAY